jgi:hypothetical protein
MAMVVMAALWRRGLFVAEIILQQAGFTFLASVRFNPIHAACEQAQWSANEVPSISYWTRPFRLLVSIAMHVLF